MRQNKPVVAQELRTRSEVLRVIMKKLPPAAAKQKLRIMEMRFEKCAGSGAEKRTKTPRTFVADTIRVNCNRR
jgi:hypothetical protein